MTPRYLDRLRALCLALPETYEKLAWSEPTFRIVNGKIFAMHATSGTHHSPERPAVWLHASKENQLFMIADRPDRFFSPPYVGPGGWIGVWLDGDVPWDELRDLIKDAWLRVAPKKVIALLDAPAGSAAPKVVSARKQPRGSRAKTATPKRTRTATAKAAKPKASTPAKSKRARPKTAKRKRTGRA